MKNFLPRLKQELRNEPEIVLLVAACVVAFGIYLIFFNE